jgi:hypothetical protein
VVTRDVAVTAAIVVTAATAEPVVATTIGTTPSASVAVAAMPDAQAMAAMEVKRAPRR